MTVLVGGVSQLYQGDHDLGRIAIARLQDEDLGPDVMVEDWYYGAVAVLQRLQELAPGTLLLMGAHERGRPPGTVERRSVDAGPRASDRVQRAVGDAVTGYVDLDITLDVIAGLDALPRRTIVFEVEPARTEPAEHLSPDAERALLTLLPLVRAEIDRTPLFDLVARLEQLTREARLSESDALDAMTALLNELRATDARGSWGATFRWRDRLRHAIAEGRTGEGMSHLDWALWWNLIEELDRLQSIEATSSGS